MEKLLLNFTLRDRRESSEMDDFRSICLLSLAMLVACYVAGIIPLAVNFSEVRQLYQITRLLVGCQGGTAETGSQERSTSRG